MAELQAIYLSPSHTRKGLGAALLKTVARHLHDDGFASLLAWVLTRNPCRRFYDKAGAEMRVRKQEDMGGFLVEKTAYTWRDIRTLL